MQSHRGFFRNAILLFSLWLLLSGRHDPLFILLGLTASAAISWLHSRQPGPSNPTIPLSGFMYYLPWLFYRILVSNLYMVYLILHPRLPIDPKVIRYRVKLRHPAGVGLLANSVTLTPGTLTVDMKAEELLVHAMDDASAKDLTSEIMERKIAHIFNKKDEAPQC